MCVYVCVCVCVCVFVAGCVYVCVYVYECEYVYVPACCTAGSIRVPSECGSRTSIREKNSFLARCAVLQCVLCITALCCSVVLYCAVMWVL